MVGGGWLSAEGEEVGFTMGMVRVPWRELERRGYGSNTSGRVEHRNNLGDDDPETAPRLARSPNGVSTKFQCGVHGVPIG